MTMNDLATKLKALKDRKDDLAEQTKANNAEIEGAEKELSNLMIDNGNDAFELNGFKFTLSYKDMFSTRVEYRDILIDALKMHGIDREEIITETIPAPKLNSIMKNIYAENGEELPEEFTNARIDGQPTPIVTIFSKQGVTIRKVSGKGGKSKTGKQF